MRRVRKKPSRLYALVLLALPSLIVGVMVVVLINWHMPTRVQVDLTVDRADFAVGDTASRRILNSAGFQSLTVQKFDHIELRPEHIEEADQTEYRPGDDQKEGWYPESAWTSLTVTAAVVIRGEEHERTQPTATLQSVKPAINSLGILDRVRARAGSQVIMEVRSARDIELTVEIRGSPEIGPTSSAGRGVSSAKLSIHEPFQLTINSGLVDGISKLPDQTDSMTYRIQLLKEDPLIEITSQSGSLVLSLMISPAQAADLFSNGSIPVTALDFIRRDDAGEYQTALVKSKKHEITYPDYPSISKVEFEHPDFIRLDGLSQFTIEKIGIDPEHKGIQLRLNGIAGIVRTKSGKFLRDHRLTLFQILRYNPGLEVLYIFLIWAASTTWAVYNVYKSL